MLQAEREGEGLGEGLDRRPTTTRDEETAVRTPERCSEESLLPVLTPAFSQCASGASEGCCGSLKDLSTDSRTEAANCLCYPEVYNGLRGVIEEQGLEDLFDLKAITEGCKREFEITVGWNLGDDCDSEMTAAVTREEAMRREDERATGNDDGDDEDGFSDLVRQLDSAGPEMTAFVYSGMASGIVNASEGLNADFSTCDELVGGIASIDGASTCKSIFESSSSFPRFCGFVTGAFRVPDEDDLKCREAAFWPKLVDYECALTSATTVARLQEKYEDCSSREMYECVDAEEAYQVCAMLYLYSQAEGANTDGGSSPPRDDHTGHDDGRHTFEEECDPTEKWCTELIHPTVKTIMQECLPEDSSEDIQCDDLTCDVEKSLSFLQQIHQNVDCRFDGLESRLSLLQSCASGFPGSGGFPGSSGGFPGNFPGGSPGGFPGNFPGSSGGFPGSFGGSGNEGSGHEGPKSPERCSEETLTPILIPAVSQCGAGASEGCCAALADLSSTSETEAANCLCFGEVYNGFMDVLKEQGLEEVFDLDNIVSGCNSEFDLKLGTFGNKDDSSEMLCLSRPEFDEFPGSSGGFPGSFGGFPGSSGGFPGSFGGSGHEGSGHEGSESPERCSEETLTPILIPAVSQCGAGASEDCCAGRGRGIPSSGTPQRGSTPSAS